MTKEKIILTSKLLDYPNYKSVDFIVNNESYRLTIQYDEFAENPRNWNNLSKFILFGRLKDQGDTHDFDNPETFLNQVNESDVILPIYKYEHGVIAFNTTGFLCPWDSGQIGYAIAEAKDIRNNFRTAYVTKKLIEKVKDTIINELEIFEAWANGIVYGFKLEKSVIICQSCKTKKWIHIDSLYGFYGKDNIDFMIKNYLPFDNDCKQELINTIHDIY